MKTLIFLIFGFLLFCLSPVYAQNVLPEISVINLNKKIIVSWLNDYKKPIQNILIQRSFDSLKNFSTIGTVLNPLNLENGYPDLTPPYDRMYYRVTITFENGEYEIGKSARPAWNTADLMELDVTAIPKKIAEEKEKTIDPEINLDSTEIAVLAQKLKVNTIKKSDTLKNINLEKSIKIDLKKSIETSFPSIHIYTNKQNVVVINLVKTDIKKYSIRFFDETEKKVFEIKRVPDDYLFIEKSNFVRPGWFNFELFEDGVLLEKNKVLIVKDKVKNN